MSSDLQALFDRVIDAALSDREQDEHDAERLDLIAPDLFAAAPLKGRARFPWAVAPLTSSGGETAFAALTERARLPLPVIVVEGVFAEEAEARSTAEGA
ncbi:MAG: hypothetical protein MUC64_18545 [Rubritepida sp.]|jgi:hypothetical protein|nr:hypothetical protein [Rubritepida sp.]